MFSYEFWDISKKTISTEHIRTTASGLAGSAFLSICPKI